MCLLININDILSFPASEKHIEVIASAARRREAPAAQRALKVMRGKENEQLAHSSIEIF